MFLLFLFEQKWIAFGCYVKPWAYNWVELTTLLSIFIFLIYLFTHLTVSVCILIIYKWYKIRAWYTFWVSISEKQPWKFIRKNHNPIFLHFALFFLVSLISQCLRMIYKVFCVYIIYYISHRLWSYRYQNVPWKHLGSMWFVWPISAFWPFLQPNMVRRS